VPDRPGSSLDAVEEVGIAVQRLPFGKLARGEFADEFNVVRGRKGRQHRAHLRCAAATGKFAVVVHKRVMDPAEPSAGGGRVEFARPGEVVPEDERVSVPAMRARRKQVARLDNWRARASRVSGHGQLPFDLGRIHTGSSARYARHDGPRPQVHEHMPRLAQHNGLVAPQAIGISDCDRGIDRTHVAILDRRSAPPADLRAGGEKSCVDNRLACPSVQECSRRSRSKIRERVAARDASPHRPLGPAST